MSTFSYKKCKNKLVYYINYSSVYCIYTLKTLILGEKCLFFIKNIT